MLDTVMRTFTRGIRDPDVCLAGTKKTGLRRKVVDRGLHYGRRLSEGKEEYIRLQKEMAKAQELQFYRELV